MRGSPSITFLNRTIIVLTAGFLFSAPAAAQSPCNDEIPSVSSVDQLVARSGDKVSGHIGACVVSLRDKPLAGFGLTKEPEAKARYTFFLLFKTGGKKFEGSGTSSQVTSDGKTTRFKTTFDIGDAEIPISIETTRDENMNVVSTKTIVGEHTLAEKGPRVVLVDLSGDRPTFKLIKAELPTSVPDLADESHKTWPAALKQALAELKKQAPELKELAD